MLIFNSLARKKFLDLQGFENLAGLWFSSYGGQVGILQVEPTKEAPTCKVSLPKEAPDLQGVASEGSPRPARCRFRRKPPTCKVSLPKEASL